MKQILLILHQENSTPGRVGQALEARGFALDKRFPRFGDPLPATLAEHAGAVIFGGPMSANDDEDFIHRETEWIGVALKEKKPFLGLCLGAQMLTRHLGGRVNAHPDGRVEVGYHSITPTPDGQSLLAWPDYVYQWHSEGFDCPKGATCLAQSEHFPVQAIKVGTSAYGLQFHPELTHAMMYRWTVKGAHRFASPGAQNRDEQMERRYLYDPPMRRFLEDFLDLWLEPDDRRLATPAAGE